MIICLPMTVVMVISVPLCVTSLFSVFMLPNPSFLNPLFVFVQMTLIIFSSIIILLMIKEVRLNFYVSHLLKLLLFVRCLSMEFLLSNNHLIFLIMFCKPNSRLVLAHTTLNDDEQPTVQGLAHSLAEMSDLIDRGIPVSPTNLESSYFDGDVDTSEVSPIDQRFFDINDAYNMTRESHQKLSKTVMSKTDVNPK